MSLLENVVVFGRLLRDAGLPLAPDQTRRFARALAWVDVGDRDQVFHAARSLLITRQEDLRLFAVIFELFWRAHSEGTELRLPRRPTSAGWSHCRATLSTTSETIPRRPTPRPRA